MLIVILVAIGLLLVSSVYALNQTLNYNYLLDDATADASNPQ